MNIGIIRYGMGNVASVEKALHALQCTITMVHTADDIDACDALILPGVGAFAKGMANLHNSNLVEPLTAAVVNNGKPFLGICLGMQLVATTGTEPEETPGLGWIDGRVEHIETDLRVPHIGWNNLDIADHSRYYADLPGNDVYFVHSYEFVPTNRDIVTATVQYDHPIVASLELNNIFVTQFHPEKSQDVGLKILQNFIDVISA